MKLKLTSIVHVLAVGALVIVLIGTLSISAAAAGTYSAATFVFVGTAGQCNPFPAGNKIIASAWTNGMGLPDNGTANPGGGTTHQGILLNKNGPTSDCS